jgi:hypothetical protein
MPDGNVVKLLTEKELAELHKDIMAEQKKSRI